MDRPNEADAEKRYRVMLDIVRKRTHVTLLDFGCGTAGLNAYRVRNGYEFIEYSGLDLSEIFVAASRKKFPDTVFYQADILRDDIKRLPDFDYIICNGVFTEKLGMSFDEMFVYFKKAVSMLFSKLKLYGGLAFNVMSKAVDWEREDLFHMPMDLLAAFLTKELSRYFVIRNDYGLYEYTVYLYKSPDECRFSNEEETKNDAESCRVRA